MTQELNVYEIRNWVSSRFLLRGQVVDLPIGRGIAHLHIYWGARPSPYSGECLMELTYGWGPHPERSWGIKDMGQLRGRHIELQISRLLAKWQEIDKSRKSFATDRQVAVLYRGELLPILSLEMLGHYGRIEGRLWQESEGGDNVKAARLLLNRLGAFVGVELGELRETAREIYGVFAKT